MTKQHDGQRLYAIRRKYRDGTLSWMIGAETWAADPEDAMRRVRLSWGYTEKKGYLALDITDDGELRRRWNLE